MQQWMLNLSYLKFFRSWILPKIACISYIEGRWGCRFIWSSLSISPSWYVLIKGKNKITVIIIMKSWIIEYLFFYWFLHYPVVYIWRSNIFYLSIKVLITTDKFLYLKRSLYIVATIVLGYFISTFMVLGFLNIPSSQLPTKSP